MSSRQGSQLVFGIVLIALGLIFLGERQHLVPIVDIGRLWPVLLIILGAGRFTAPREDGSHRNGLWLVFIGGLFLLNNYNIFPLQESWPLFIVAGGLSLAFGRKCGRPTGERLQP
jgi:hypothetical protein